MSSLLFVLGRTPELSLLELAAFFPSSRRLSEHVVLVEDVEDSVPYHKIFDQLGGCIKVALVVGKERTISYDILTSYFRSYNEKSITFGISSYDNAFIISASLLQSIKRELEKTIDHVRFIAPQTSNDLTSVVVAKQNVDERIIAKGDSDFLIAKTLIVQSFESWNHRDYGRPFADAKSGMLPPKVARIAVNLAMRAILASEPGSSDNKDWIPGPSSSAGRQARNDNGATLLDPFCGMGTIVAEALLTGWHVVASDQSADTIEKARKNIEWVMNNGITGGRDWKLFVSDAAHISEHVQSESVDAIATEPFMGSARKNGNTQIHDVRNIIKGLEKLYIGCLKDWYGVLKPHGKVVIALPEYAIAHQTFFVKKVIDKCENLGYTVLAGPIEYSRPQAVVRRKFYVLQKNVRR